MSGTPAGFVARLDRLREAGVEVWHDVTPGTDHYFLTEDPVRARTTMGTVAAEVAAAFGNS